MSSTTVSSAPCPMVSQGLMENFDKEHMGVFIGKGGIALKKFVTGKSAFQIKEAYEKDFDGSSTPPGDLGPILIKVKVEEVDGEMEFTISIHNDKENLDVYQPIVKDNLFRHARNCSREKKNNFRNNIVFTAEISHEGMIGKFVGSKGKNIKMLSEKVKQALGVKYLSIKIIPENEAEKVRTLKNKTIRINTNPNNNFQVQIIVSVNLPEELFKDYTGMMRKLAPLINDAVMKLDEDVHEENEIMADIFLGNWVPNGKNDDDDDDDDDDGWKANDIPVSDDEGW